MRSFRLQAAKAALLIVDLQYGSASRDHGYSASFRRLGYDSLTDAYTTRIERTVVPNVAQLQAAFRAAHSPVVFLTVGTLTGDYSDLVPAFQLAVAYWQERGIPPPYARPGSREMSVLDEIAPLDGEHVITKTGASPFTGTNIQEVLAGRGISQLALVGVATNYCVQSTLRDAADRGYDCVLVEDACADVTDEFHTLGLQSSAPFCRISTAADVIAELHDE
jgi:nicotinamidase-related amidase